MNNLEIFKATVNHEEHAEFLFYAEFTPDLAERLRKKNGLDKDADLRSFFGMYKPVQIKPDDTREAPACDFSAYYADVDKPEGAFINKLGVLNIPANYYHFTGYVSPLRNASRLSDIENFPYPQAYGFDEAAMKKKVDDAHRAGNVAASSMAHMYENAWQVRGYQEFLIDMVERPEWCEYILDRFMERNLNLAVAAAKAGVDVIRTGDDVANQNALMFSPGMWRKFIGSRWAKVYAAVRDVNPDIQIWYHSDGNIEKIIPEMIEYGLTILNPVQPECMDIYNLKEQYGRQLVFDGAIGTQTAMPFASPHEIKELVAGLKRDIGNDGALILSPTHILEPDVPVENVEAFVAAASSIGTER